MKHHDDPTQAHPRVPDWLAGRTSTGLRVVLATVAGLVLMLSAVLLAVVLGVVVVLWKLLGKRGGRTTPRFGRGRAGTSRQQATQIDVIDVEAREVAGGGR